MNKLVTTARYSDTDLLLYKCLGVRLIEIAPTDGSGRYSTYKRTIENIKEILTDKQIATDLKINPDYASYNIYEKQGKIDNWNV